MKTKTKYWTVLTVLLAVLVGAVATGCGSGDGSGSESDSGAAGNSTDRAFVADMVPHHKSAVEMTDLANSEATSAFVKRLAANISETQKREITQMKGIDRQLADAGVKKGELGMSHSMEGMSMDAQQLRGAKPFDAKFIKMMVPHHESAIEMANIEVKKGQNPQLRRLAQDIISAQEGEVKQMQDHAKSTATTADDGVWNKAQMDDEHGSGH